MKHLAPAWILVSIIGLTATVDAAPVGLGTWTAESYPSVSGFGAGVWNVSGDSSSVFQSVNGQPTMFYSDFLAHNTDAEGKIEVSSSGGDDDYIGFVLGFDPGDATNSAADYLLVDWKRGTQSHNFGAPSTRPGSTADRGLAVSRVTGIPTADEFWGHTNFASHTGGGVEELARGNTLGDTGWSHNTEYSFQFVFLPDRLQVVVDGKLEIDITGTFENGRLGFYNFSQAHVTYSAFTVDPRTDPIDPDPVPEPASLALFGLGAAVATMKRRRRRRD